MLRCSCASNLAMKPICPVTQLKHLHPPSFLSLQLTSCLWLLLVNLQHLQTLFICTAGQNNPCCNIHSKEEQQHAVLNMQVSGVSLCHGCTTYYAALLSTVPAPTCSASVCCCAQKHGCTAMSSITWTGQYQNPHLPLFLSWSWDVYLGISEKLLASYDTQTPSSCQYCSVEVSAASRFFHTSEPRPLSPVKPMPSNMLMISAHNNSSSGGHRCGSHTWACMLHSTAT